MIAAPFADIAIKLPDRLEDYGPIRTFWASASPSPLRGEARGTLQNPSKLLNDLDAAIAACSLTHGSTVSFHHHLRNGDGVLNAVMEAIARRGLRDVHVAATSLFPVHAPLIDHVRNGTVGSLSASSSPDRSGKQSRRASCRTRWCCARTAAGRGRCRRAN